MKYQRLISLILVLCMCVSFFPAPAFADDEGGSSGNGNAGDHIYVAKIGETKYRSLKAAVEAAVTQDTIVLIADSESDETVVISGKVISAVDCGTHTLFVAEVTEAKTLSEEPSMTYQYYFDHVKPKPQPVEQASWVCKICGYVYEGDPLPADFICPWCKHGAEDFEKQ